MVYQGSKDKVRARKIRAMDDDAAIKAVRLGDEKVIRAAASTNGANPLPVVIPCHRVIGSDGSLIGYGGGLKIKEKLLVLEGSRQKDLFNL